jgi:hypothetical protein
MTWRPASIAPRRDRTGTHRDGEGRGLEARVPGPHPQPEMQADHRVTPGDDQDQHLYETMIGRADEIDPEQIGVIADIGVEETVRDARRDDVADEQERDAEAEHDLA